VPKLAIWCLTGALMSGIALWPVQAAAAAPVVAAREPIVGPNGELPEGWTNTQWGPLGPVDIALIEGVRRADLWEGPAGRMAVEKGFSDRVRQIGETISHQHTNELDPVVLDLAGKLGLQLPDTPSDEQNQWLAEMVAANGPEFDQVFVDRLRAAHGKVFQLIAQVRANTRNSLVRKFAQTANKYVDGHISLLDSTNLVAWELLPTPVAPPAAAKLPGSGPPASVSGGLSPAVIWAVLIVALIAGAMTTGRILRPR
jgi:predicted outer membrane protein